MSLYGRLFGTEAEEQSEDEEQPEVRVFGQAHYRKLF